MHNDHKALKQFLYKTSNLMAGTYIVQYLVDDTWLNN